MYITFFRCSGQFRRVGAHRKRKILLPADTDHGTCYAAMTERWGYSFRRILNMPHAQPQSPEKEDTSSGGYLACRLLYAITGTKLSFRRYWTCRMLHRNHRKRRILLPVDTEHVACSTAITGRGGYSFRRILNMPHTPPQSPCNY